MTTFVRNADEAPRDEIEAWLAANDMLPASYYCADGIQVDPARGVIVADAVTTRLQDGFPNREYDEEGHWVIKRIEYPIKVALPSGLAKTLQYYPS